MESSMTRPARPLVSVLVPAFNEEENIERTAATIAATFARLPSTDYEIIFTDNHSTDSSFALLEALAAADPRIRVIRFSRNCGYQRSVLAAYQSARGDCAVQLDCDLQDPPALIADMLSLWREGHDVVYGVRRSLPDGLVIGLARRLFYRIIRALSEDDLPANAGEFRLVDRRILVELRKVEDTTPYVRGLISAMGFSQVGLVYDRAARTAGVSKFPLGKMLGMAVDGLLNHSLVPLRVASLTALVVGTMTFLLIVGYLVGHFLFGHAWPSGFATTTLLLLLSIMLNAMFFGILGEYVGRIFLQSKRRSLPIIEMLVNCDDEAPARAVKEVSVA
jgi:glycosyltransferase involved in cell wall biosynthesis